MLSPGAAKADPPYVRVPWAVCAREHPESPALEDAPLLNYDPPIYRAGSLASHLLHGLSREVAPAKASAGMVLRYS